MGWFLDVMVDMMFFDCVVDLIEEGYDVVVCVVLNGLKLLLLVVC